MPEGADSVARRAARRGARPPRQGRHQAGGRPRPDDVAAGEPCSAPWPSRSSPGCASPRARPVAGRSRSLISPTASWRSSTSSRRVCRTRRSPRGCTCRTSGAQRRVERPGQGGGRRPGGRDRHGARGRARVGPATVGAPPSHWRAHGQTGATALEVATGTSTTRLRGCLRASPLGRPEHAQSHGRGTSVAAACGGPAGRQRRAAWWPRTWSPGGSSHRRRSRWPCRRRSTV